MNILLTNDDGYGTIGHELLQVAVDKIWPGATSSRFRRRRGEE